MNTSIGSLRAALAVSLTLLITACAGGGGAGWTYAPVSTAGGATAACPSGAPGATTEAATAAAGTGLVGTPAATSGGAGATAGGAGATACPSGAPGPTTAATGAAGTGLVGTPAATNGGAAATNGGAAATAGGADATAGGADATAGGAGATGSPAAGSPGAGAGGGTIELEETVDLRIKQGGQAITSLALKPGAAYTFRITNTAGYDHNFWIGPAGTLQAPNATGVAGVPNFVQGTQEFQYTPGPDITTLEFACTVPGHYPTMHGTFTIQP